MLLIDETLYAKKELATILLSSDEKMLVIIIFSSGTH